MPSLEGAAHLIDELRAGLPEGEVAITELASCREKFGGETVTGGIGWGQVGDCGRRGWLQHPGCSKPRPGVLP